MTATLSTLVNHNGNRRHVGGSLLPSSDPRILQPIICPGGTLQVRVLKELDTHGLFWKAAKGVGEGCIAEHSNGYSCHELAKRMAAGRVEHAQKQRDYILCCGGMARSEESITNIIEILGVKESARG